VRVYGWARKTGGVAWYRIREPLRGLSLLGHTVGCGPELNMADALDYDVIITSVHGEHEGTQGWETLARLPNRPKLVYDIDDDVWNFRKGLHQYEYWQDEELLRNVQSSIACADLVTTPSPVLANIVAKLNPNVVVLPNYVPMSLLLSSPLRPQNFTVGYQGGDTHKFDVAAVGLHLLKFLARNTDAYMAVWGASSYDDGLFPGRVKLHPWNRSVKDYYASLSMSVGLAPLERNPFNDAKSAVKAVEYAALGVPCIATDSLTYEGTVEHGATGYLLSNRADWCQTLEGLKQEPMVLAAMGQAAWRRAQGWTTERNAWRWESAYRG